MAVMTISIDAAYVPWKLTIRSTTTMFAAGFFGCHRCHRSSVEGTHTTGWVDVRITVEHRKTLLMEQALLK